MPAAAEQRRISGIVPEAWLCPAVIWGLPGLSYWPTDPTFWYELSLIHSVIDQPQSRLWRAPPKRAALKTGTTKLAFPCPPGGGGQNLSTWGFSCETFALLKFQLVSRGQRERPHACMCSCWRGRQRSHFSLAGCWWWWWWWCTGVVIATCNSNYLALHC